MKNLQLRKATAENSEFTYQTEKSAFREYVEKVRGWDEDREQQFHLKCFASQDFQIIQVSGVDVGFLSLTRQPDFIKVHKLFISPKHQSKGFGEAVMKLLIEEASALKLPVRLQVLKVNSRAFAFYQRLGFKRTSENDTHVLMERLSESA